MNRVLVPLQLGVWHRHYGADVGLNVREQHSYRTVCKECTNDTKLWKRAKAKDTVVTKDVQVQGTSEKKK